MKALGPRLQFLSITYMPWRPSYKRTPQDSLLVPAIIRNCPLLAHLQFEDLRPHITAEVL